MTENEISKIIFDCGLKVHRALGVDFYENVYEQCLEHELKKAGLKVERQKNLSVTYDGIVIERAGRFDMLVEDKVIVENKTVGEITKFDSWQTYHYLRATGLKLGMILNFHSLLFKDGVKRIVNGLEE